MLQAMATSANPILQGKEERDPTLFCTAFKRPRFYTFTRSEPECVLRRVLLDCFGSFLIRAIHSCYFFRDAKGNTDRDVLNEKPTREEQTLAVHEGTHAGKGSKNSPFAHSAVIHTTLGDMHLKLFPQHAPKAVENFVGHARSGYYENVIVHRVIKKFVSVTSQIYILLMLEDGLLNLFLIWLFFWYVHEDDPNWRPARRWDWWNLYLGPRV